MNHINIILIFLMFLIINIYILLLILEIIYLKSVTRQRNLKKEKGNEIY